MEEAKKSHFPKPKNKTYIWLRTPIVGAPLLFVFQWNLQSHGHWLFKLQKFKLQDHHEGIKFSYWKDLHISGLK